MVWWARVLRTNRYMMESRVTNERVENALQHPSHTPLSHIISPPPYASLTHSLTHSPAHHSTLTHRATRRRTRSSHLSTSFIITDPLLIAHSFTHAVTLTHAPHTLTELQGARPDHRTYPLLSSFSLTPPAPHFLTHHRATRRLTRSSHLSTSFITTDPPLITHSLTHAVTLTHAPHSDHSTLTHRATRPRTRSSAAPWRATPLPGCTPPSTLTPLVGWTQAPYTLSQVSDGHHQHIPHALSPFHTLYSIAGNCRLQQHIPHSLSLPSFLPSPLLT